MVLGTMSVGGLVSGLQTESIITQLIEIEQRPILLQQQKEAAFQVKLSAYGSMESLLDRLDTAAKKLDSATDLTAFTASSSDTDLFTASADSTASAGNYDLTIYELAQAHKLKSSTFAKGEQVMARITIDATNNKIDFKEDTGSGIGAEKTATLTTGTYTFTELAAEIETQMNAANGTNVEYKITYDNTNSKFVFTDAGTGSNSLTELRFLWKTGTNGSDNGDISTAEVLGFATSADDTGAATYTADYAITAGNTLTITAGTNDKIDFKEIGTGTFTLASTLTAGNYTFDTLATEIKTQLEADSLASGNNYTYAVAYDYATQKFSISSAEATLTELQFLWNSGANSAATAATTIGYSTSTDDSGAKSYSADNKASIGTGTITITVGTDTAVAVSVAATDTLQDIASNINDSAANVTATVIDDGTWRYLQISSGTSGKDYAVDITVTDADGNNTDAYGLSRLAFTTGTSNMTQVDAAQNAIINLDGSTITRNTNTLTDVLTGVDITLDSNAAIDTLTIDATNNKLDIKENDGGPGATFAVTLTDGTYTYTELAAQIESQLETASAASGLGVNYTVAFNHTSKKFSINGSGGTMTGNLELLWNTGGNSATSVGSTIGFNTAADDVTAAGTAITADNTKSVTSTSVLSITKNTSTLTSNLKSFVTAYNNLTSFFATYAGYDEDTKKAGLLLGDSTTNFIRNKLSKIVGSDITGAVSFNYLSDLGIATLDDGTLEIDDDVLAGNLRDNYEDAVNFLTTSSTGFGVLMSDALDYILDPTDGILQSRKDGINDSIDDIQTKVDNMERRLAQVEERMRLQFAALEVLLAEFETTSNYLSQQISGLQNLNASISGKR